MIGGCPVCCCFKGWECSDPAVPFVLQCVFLTLYIKEPKEKTPCPKAAGLLWLGNVPELGDNRRWLCQPSARTPGGVTVLSPRTGSGFSSCATQQDF